MYLEQSYYAVLALGNSAILCVYKDYTLARAVVYVHYIAQAKTIKRNHRKMVLGSGKFLMWFAELLWRKAKFLQAQYRGMWHHNLPASSNTTALCYQTNFEQETECI